MALFEIKRQVANTEAGQEQLNYEKAIAMMDAYGSMYRSYNKGQEFSRTAVAVQCVMKYNIQFGWDDEYEEDEDEY